MTWQPDHWAWVDQWCTGPAECLRCGCEWVGVWPLNAGNLECPDCGETDTVREDDEPPASVRRPTLPSL